MRILSNTLIILFMFCSSYGSKYDEARELYKQGPTKGPEIVELLRTHLKENTEDLEATKLLAITLFGIERTEECLPVIDRAIKLTEDKEEISAKMLMLKARALFHLERYEESRLLLEVYWAFWQKNPELEKLYQYYYPKVLKLTSKSKVEPVAGGDATR